MHHGLAPVRCNADEAIRILFPPSSLPPNSTFQFFFFIPEEQQNWTWFRHTIQPRLFLHFLEHWAGSLVILSERGRHGWDARGGWIHALRFAVGRIGTARRRGVEGDGNVKPFSGFSDNWMRRARCIATGFRNGIQRAKRGCVWKVAAGGREGRVTHANRSRKGGKKRPSRWTSWLVGGRKLIIFRLPGVTMAFCAFGEGLGDVFLG